MCFRAFRGKKGAGAVERSSVGPVGGVPITGLAALGFLLHAAGLTALARTALCVLCEVVVQHLGVGLLMRGKNVQERSRGVARSAPGVQGTCPGESRGQTEGRWCAGVEALFVKRLCFAVDCASHIRNSSTGA